MCTKPYRPAQDREIPEPRKPEDLYAEAERRKRRKEMQFIEDTMR